MNNQPTPPPDTPTPRTDALADEVTRQLGWSASGRWMADLARIFERDLAAVTAERDRLREALEIVRRSSARAGDTEHSVGIKWLLELPMTNEEHSALHAALNPKQDTPNENR